MWFQHQTKQPTLYLVVDDNQAALITWDTDRHATHPFSVTSYTALPSEWFLHGVPWHVSSFTTYLHSYITQHNLKKPLLVCACNGATLYEKTVSLTHTPTQAAIPPDAQYAHYAWHASSLPTQQKQVPTERATDTKTFEIPTPPSTLDTPTSTDTNTPLSAPSSHDNSTQSTTPTQDTLLSTTQAHTSPQEDAPNTTSYLVNGMPHSDILRLRLCADKSGCTLHRVTTIRSSMQPLYTYCQRHGIVPVPTQESSSHDAPTQEDAQHTTTNPETAARETAQHKPNRFTSTSPETLLTMLCAPLPETHNHRLVLSALGLSLFERKLV